MKIVVYDIAAKKGGGGETILKQYINIAVKDLYTEWWFFTSIKEYVKYETKNIHIIYVDLAASSQLMNYISRKKYEMFQLKAIIRNIDPDEVISLQNMVVPGVKCKQVVYLHQSLQFSPVKYSFLKKEERVFAFRQRIICNLIKIKLHKADKVIVQTNWMKKAVSKWAKYPEEKITVEMPKISMPEQNSYELNRNNIFFYPANAYLNKNHKVIVEACKILKDKCYSGFSVQFTVSADNNSLSKEIISEIKKHNLPIFFIGHLSKEELFQKYRSEIMLFPSYIETFGLPLLEAKKMGGRIIASACPFAYEILHDYEMVEFVSWDSPNEWALAMEKFLILNEN